ncbi:MAG: aspartate carbamoyltransferase [Vulcanimicrobiaceae bacterium]
MRPDLARLVLAATLITALSSPVLAADTSGHVNVERKGERVMPFSMGATMHMFRPTPDGGVQTVMVHNGDERQVLLVRSHLRKEAAAFARGDFTDPAAIHGDGMPGLQAMRTGARRISVRYSERPNGAAIIYATRDPKLVSAIHAWFHAQVSDHGAHAAMTM